MQHARADSARRALPQVELQASVVGNSAAGYVAAVRVVVGETAMATGAKTGMKFGPLKDGTRDGKENILLLVPRKPGTVLAVPSPVLAGHVTYPPFPPSHDESACFLPRCCCAFAVRSLPFLCFRRPRPRLLRESLVPSLLCAASPPRTVRSAPGGVVTATIRSSTRATPLVNRSSATPSESATAMLPPRWRR